MSQVALLLGLYFKLRKYNLPYPEAVFDGGFFRQVAFHGNHQIMRQKIQMCSFSGPKTFLWVDQGDIPRNSRPHNNTQVFQSASPKGYSEEVFLKPPILGLVLRSLFQDLHSKHRCPGSACWSASREDNRYKSEL